MYAFSEFYEENGVLNAHIECYIGVAKHYADYSLSKENTDKLKMVLQGDDLVKTLTKCFAAGNAFPEFLAENGIEYVMVGKGYEDTSSDV